MRGAWAIIDYAKVNKLEGKPFFVGAPPAMRSGLAASFSGMKMRQLQSSKSQGRTMCSLHLKNREKKKTRGGGTTWGLRKSGAHFLWSEERTNGACRTPHWDEWKKASKH